MNKLLETFQELNLSNYGPDDVDRLNGWAIDAYAELSEIKAQEPVAWINNETLDERVKAKFGSYYLAPVRSDEDNTPLYATPVAPAADAGLVEALEAMLEECDPMKLNCGEPWCRARAAIAAAKAVKP